MPLGDGLPMGEIYRRSGDSSARSLALAIDLGRNDIGGIKIGCSLEMLMQVTVYLPIPSRDPSIIHSATESSLRKGRTLCFIPGGRRPYVIPTGGTLYLMFRSGGISAELAPNPFELLEPLDSI
jgi:hypothetical protein